MRQFGIRTLLILTAVVAAVLGTVIWLSAWPSLEIPSDSIAVAATHQIEGPDTVWGFRVAVEGYIDGTATLTILEQDAVWRSLPIGPGTVRQSVGGDLYTSDVRIDYAPGTATTGYITIKYKFN